MSPMFLQEGDQPFATAALHTLLLSAGMWMDDMRRYRAAEAAFVASAELAAKNRSVHGSPARRELMFDEHLIRLHAAQSALADGRPEDADLHCRDAMRTALIHCVTFEKVASLALDCVRMLRSGGVFESAGFFLWLVGELHDVAAHYGRLSPELVQLSDRAKKEMPAVSPPVDAAEWRTVIRSL